MTSIQIKHYSLTALFAYTTTALSLTATDAYDYVDDLAETIAEQVLYTNDGDYDEYVDLT
jgi:hypothetical protein